MQANNELLKVPGPNQTDQSAQGNSCSQNDLTSELLQIMDRPPDEADFDSHDLIEDQAGGPLAFSHDCGSLLDADDKILGSTPELPSKSYKKTNSDHPLEEIDGNLSSDAKDILDKLELQPLRHVPRLPADVDDYDICLGDDKSNLEVARTPKKNGFCSGIVNYNGEKASYGLPRLEKYRAMAVPILEESDECISHCQILLSNWITRFKSRLLADLKVCAVSFSCDYNMKVGIVSDTMMMEKAKQTISKLRDVRRCLLRHGLTKLLLFKERHHQQSLFSSRLIESRSNIDQPASGACTFITGDQRKKLVQKIAVNILNNSSASLLRNDRRS